MTEKLPAITSPERFFSLIKDLRKIPKLGDRPDALMLLKSGTLLAFNGIIWDDDEWCQMTTMGLLAFDAIAYATIGDANVRDTDTGKILHETVMACGAFRDPDTRRCFMTIKKNGVGEMVDGTRYGCWIDHEEEWSGHRSALFTTQEYLLNTTMERMEDEMREAMKLSGHGFGSTEDRMKNFQETCKRRGWEFGVRDL